MAPHSSQPASAEAAPSSDGAPIDAVTGLGARVRLLADLDALREQTRTHRVDMLAAFGLNGLDEYSRTHSDADVSQLLRRLAERLVNALGGAGEAYVVGHGCFGVLARVGRGGSRPIVRACTAALTDERAAIVARPLLARSPIDLIKPADAMLMLTRAGTVTDEQGKTEGEARAAVAILPHLPRLGAAEPRVDPVVPAPTLEEARRSVPRRGDRRLGRLPYLRISTRFGISVACGLIWMGLSAWLAQPWINQLARTISLPAAIALIAGLALIPGYLNVQLLSSLLMDHPVPIDPDFPYAYPALTLLVAAYNEQATIAQTVAYGLEQDYPSEFEVMVIDDGSLDDTADIARGFARLDDRLSLLSVPHGGKAAALNAGLKASRTPLVATIDADTLLMPGALRRIVARMLVSPEDTTAVAGNVMVRNSRSGIIAAAQTWDYLLGIGSVKRQQALLQATLVAQGAFSVYDTVAVRAAGGWPDCIGEDIVMTWALLNAGGRTTYEPTAVAFTEAPGTLRHLARQRRRWARGMIEGLRAYGLSLVRRRKTYAHSVIANAMFPYLDSVFTFAFLPGVVLAMTGNFMIVGPMTLAVLPLNGALAAIMYRVQRRSLRQAGLRVRRAIVGFGVFFLLYQVFMSPISVSGYVQELFHLNRRW